MTTDERSWKVNMTWLGRRILALSLAANAVLLILDAGQHLAELWYFEHIKDLSNVLMENSFGTWFSVLLNAGAGAVAMGVALCCRKFDKPRAKVWAWGAIGLFFFYVSLDDHLVLHERLAGGIARAMVTFELSDASPFLTYEWIYLFVPLFGLFGLFMLAFLFRELRSLRNRAALFLALALWVLAVGLDAWEGAGLPYEGARAVTGMTQVKVRHAVMLAEEMMELLGSTLFLYLFLTRLRALVSEQPTKLELLG